MLCGGALTAKDKHAWECQTCGQRIYRNNAACADGAVINDKNELLIVTRALEPGKGRWDLPGGFVDVGETSEEALLRELHEELGLSSDDIKHVEYLRSGAGEYQWDNDITHVLAATFLVRVSSDITLRALDDVAKIQWVPIKQIDNRKLFFRPHEKVIEILNQKLL